MIPALRAVPCCLAVLALIALSSCAKVPTGPTLANITVGALSLAPTASDNNICCCRVIGTVTEPEHRACAGHVDDHRL